MIGDLTNIDYMHVKCPCLGLGFYVNPPVLPPIAPGRGVVGHYIDRCIMTIALLDHSCNKYCNMISY